MICQEFDFIRKRKMHFTRLVTLGLVVALILLFVVQSLPHHVQTAHKNFSRSTHAKPNNASDVKANNGKLAETEKPMYCAASFKTSAGSEMQHTHVARHTFAAATEAVGYTTPAKEGSIKSAKHETHTKSSVDTNDKPRTKSVSGNDKSKSNTSAHTLLNASNSTRFTEIKNSEHIDTKRRHEANRAEKPKFQLVEIA